MTFLSDAIDHIIELGKENGENFVIDSLEDLISNYQIAIINFSGNYPQVDDEFTEEDAEKLLSTAIRYELKNKLFNEANVNAVLYKNLKGKDISQEGLQLLVETFFYADHNPTYGFYHLNDFDVLDYDYKENEEVLFVSILKNIAENRVEKAQYFFEVLRRLNKNVDKVYNYPNLPKNILTKKLFKVESKTQDSLIALIQKYNDFFKTPYYYEVLHALKNTSLTDEQLRKIEKGHTVRIRDMKNLQEFTDVSEKALGILHKHGLYEKEDLEKLSKKELLALEGIGKKTAEVLEKNGVSFRE